MTRRISNTLGWIVGGLMCLITLVSARSFSKLPLGVGPVHYFAGFSMIGITIYYFVKDNSVRRFNYLFPILYVLWSFMSIYRGCFEISSGFVFNQFLHGILYVLSPILLFLFANPRIGINTLRVLNPFIVIFTLLSLHWNLRPSGYPFCLVPFFSLYLCFLYKIPKPWLIITVVCVGMVLSVTNNSSGLIKTFAALGILIISLLPNKLRNFSLNIGFWAVIIGTFTLLYLGATGKYNVFKGEGVKKNPDTIVVGFEDEEESKKTSHIDTRTFIYEEMIGSAILYHHVWVGRTPARGYYSPAFGKDADDSIVGIDANERFSSEVAHLNTFHWLGIIGLLLMIGVFMQGTFLGLYHSNNKYVKCLALWCIIQWAYGWVENPNFFQLLDVMIYFNLALCYSNHFRKMTDYEFECWFKSIFTKIGETPKYFKYQKQKDALLLSILRNSSNNNQIKRQ